MAPIGSVATNPSASTQVSVSQAVALLTARPRNRNIPETSVLTTPIGALSAGRVR
jgi:hypothetical protein